METFNSYMKQKTRDSEYEKPKFEKNNKLWI